MTDLKNDLYTTYLIGFSLKDGLSRMETDRQNLFKENDDPDTPDVSLYIKLEAAYTAGMLRAAEIAEQGFESASADGKHTYNYNAGRCDAPWRTERRK